MRLFDTHCHLDAPFDRSLDSLVAQARAAGVQAILLPAVRPEGWTGSAAVAARFDEVRLALGIHPQAVRDLSDDEIDAALASLPRRLEQSGAVAVGEIGLDHAHDRDPVQRARQRRVFEAQLDVAAALKLPPLIHCLRAHGAVVEILEARGEAPGVLHAYSGSAELVQRYLRVGVSLSFSGALTVPGARRVPAACREVPEDRLLIETDAPYQAPHPKDGGPNRPDRLIEVARAVAAVRDQPVERVASCTWDNAERLFG